MGQSENLDALDVELDLAAPPPSSLSLGNTLTLGPPLHSVDPHQEGSPN